MGLDKKFLICGLIYAVIGMLLGAFMGASHNHTQHVTHAHILLVGFVLSLIYGVIHKLWLGNAASIIARTQFMVHQIGAAAMIVGLFLLYGNMVPEARIGPILGISSIIVLLGVLLMLYMVSKAKSSLS